MELDDMKNTWLSLDERLKKQEVLKESIMKELLLTKSDKALNRLIGLEVFGDIVVLLIIPVIIYAVNLHIDWIEYRIFMYAMLVVSVLTACWQTYKIYGLMKVDFSKTVSINIEQANKYNIRIKREKIVMLFFVPVLLLFCVYLYAQLNVSGTVWGIMACSFIALTLFSVWSYKKLYDKNIASILKSLDELKELEE